MRNKNPKIHYMKLAENMTPKLRYDGKEDFFSWQKKAKDKLAQLLGIELIEKCDLDFLEEDVTETESYTEIKFSFQSEPGYYAPCCVRIPKNYKGKLVPMICVQGHSTGMHISLGIEKYSEDKYVIEKEEQYFAAYALENGYCPVMIEQRFMGVCGGTEDGPGCNTDYSVPYRMSVLSYLALGRTAIGERVWDITRLIDVLEEYFPMLDTENVCCMGHSGGGTAVFYAACIDERIKAVMPSGAVCTFRHSIIGLKHCPCNYIQGIARYFDMGDLAGLIAPRKLVVVSGQLDFGFLIEGAVESVEIASKLYESAGCPENIVHVVGEHGHKFFPKESYKAFNKLVK